MIEVEEWQDSPNPIETEPQAALSTQSLQDSSPIFNDVYWNVLQAVDRGQSIELSTYESYETLGRFMHVTRGLENRGTTARGIYYPLGSIDEYDNFYVVMVDDMERQYAPFESGVAFEDECVRADVNPGLTTQCWIVFEIAADAEDLSLRLVQRTDSTESAADIVIDLQ